MLKTLQWRKIICLGEPFKFHSVWLRFKLILVSFYGDFFIFPSGEISLVCRWANNDKISWNLCVCNQIGLEKNLWSHFSPATNWWKDRRVNVELFGSALFVMIHEPYYNAVFWYVQSFPCFIHNVSKEIVSVQHMLKKNFWMNISFKRTIETILMKILLSLSVTHCCRV